MISMKFKQIFLAGALTLGACGPAVTKYSTGTKLVQTGTISSFGNAKDLLVEHLRRTGACSSASFSGNTLNCYKEYTGKYCSSSADDNTEFRKPGLPRFKPAPVVMVKCSQVGVIENSYGDIQIPFLTAAESQAKQFEDGTNKVIIKVQERFEQEIIIYTRNEEPYDTGRSRTTTRGVDIVLGFHTFQEAERAADLMETIRKQISK